MCEDMFVSCNFFTFLCQVFFSLPRGLRASLTMEIKNHFFLYFIVVSKLQGFGWCCFVSPYKLSCRSQHYDYNFDPDLERRLEQKIDEELAKSYPDEEEEEPAHQEQKQGKAEHEEEVNSDSQVS